MDSELTTQGQADGLQTGIPNCDRLVGLYSFPKSGNTWLRAIIAAIFKVPTPMGTMAEYVIDTHMGQKIGKRPWSFQDKTWCFYKSHNKTPEVLEGSQVIRPDLIVYIYRHPLDIFTSYLNYLSGNVTSLSQKVFGFSFDKVEDLTPEQLEFLFKRFSEHGKFDLREDSPFGSIFESFDNFVALRDAGAPVHVLRYEDLIDDFDAAVTAICAFLQVKLELGDIESIRDISEGLTAGDGKFFWKKQVGTHQTYLTHAQIDAFWEEHRVRMATMGYER